MLNNDFLSKNVLNISNQKYPEMPDAFLNQVDLPLETKNSIEIVKIKDAMQHIDFRLVNLETKFDKFETTINNRFDKLEEINDTRRKEMNEQQQQVVDALSKAINKFETISNELKIKETALNDEVKKIKDEVTSISNLKYKALGIVAAIIFIITIFGDKLLKLLIG